MPLVRTTQYKVNQGMIRRVCPVTVDVAEPRHLRRFPFERLFDSAAPHVVSRNVETQSRIFFFSHGNVAGPIYEVRVYVGVARAPDSSCPPRERAAQPSQVFHVLVGSTVAVMEVAE